MTTDMVLAWAAGFFDGEGCVRIRRYAQDGKNGTVFVSVGQKDPRPLERFADLFGLTVRGPYGPRQMHMVQATGRKAIWVMQQLYPLLCGPKQEQWDALEVSYIDGRTGKEYIMDFVLKNYDA